MDVPDDKELGFSSGITNIVQTIGNLAPNRLLVFGVAYEGSSGKIPTVEVFADGMEAKFIYNISEAPKWNPYRVFYLPGYILAGGLALTLLWIIGSVVLSNEEYRKLFITIGASIGNSFMLSLPGIGELYSNIKKELEKPNKGIEKDL
ncbi:hypothetical protein ACFL9T_10615 [Thermodesulfobacteriota bacterium]